MYLCSRHFYKRVCIMYADLQMSGMCCATVNICGYKVLDDFYNNWNGYIKSLDHSAT